MPIVSVYAAVLALVYVALSIRVVTVRRAALVAIGDGGDKVLQRRIRAHANFAEYVPIALILIALAESNGAPVLMLHALGSGLIVGRVVHALNISSEQERIPLRVVGMATTFTVILVAALANLILGLPRL